MQKLLLISATLLLLGAGCGSPVARPAPADGTHPPEAANAPVSAPTKRPAPHAKSKAYTISMEAIGFSPAILTIAAGDTVMFRNDDVIPFWPASDLHPTHQICPGFDARRSIAPGETYSHTFTVRKECPYHDHLNPSLTLGKIIVK